MNVQGHNGHFAETVPRLFGKASAKTRAIVLFVLAVFVSAWLTTRLFDTTNTVGLIFPNKISAKPQRQKVEVPLNCSAYDPTRTCPSNYPTTHNPGEDQDRPSPATCPDYFRWIHEDLRPWARTGITRDMVERARRGANFRLVIVKGRAYVETYKRAYQTRDVFTLWGILQLLRWYPGRLPDFELSFECNDLPLPMVFARDHSGPNATSLPPLFRYCGNDDSLYIVFPDWSFWGWPETNIKPWVPLMKDLEEANKMTKWEDREPYAYWKGNPFTGATRRDLIKCNVSEQQDWNARLYVQDWGREIKEGFNKSNLANQCVHRYKIYIEGNAWSVSDKYILACDSVTLLVKPLFYDFFTRSLKPRQHYWPINDKDKCRSIKFAVDWGNTHKEEAQATGKAANKFIKEEVKMEYVYDYMFHLLNEYAKLLRFKPTIPEKAVEICSESMACTSQGLRKDFMIDSMVTSPSDSEPCTLPPPYGPSSLYTLLQRNSDSIEQVEKWQNEYWENQTKKPQ